MEGLMRRYEVVEMGLLGCRDRVRMLVAEIAVLVIAKLAILNEFGEGTANVAVQF